MNWGNEIDYSTPPGLVPLRLGDVLAVGGVPHIVAMVNDCRARVEPLAKRHVERTTRFGKKVEFDAAGHGANVCVHVEPGVVLERRGKAGLDEFLAGRKAKARKADGVAENDNNDGEGKEIDDMAAKLRKLKGEKKSGKARGGLAADAERAAEQPPKAESGSKGKLGHYLGFSIVSVLRRLAKEGASTARVRAIAEAKQFGAKPSTVQIQCCAGRSGTFGGKPVTYAGLTGEQVADLLAAAPEPESKTGTGSKG